MRQQGRSTQQDAERIATYIRSEVDAGRRTFSDFLILTRKKRNRIAPYAAALEALNIPIEVSGAGAFGESAEVEALTCCCARSPIPGCAVARRRPARPAVRHQRSRAVCVQAGRRLVQIFHEPRRGRRAAVTGAPSRWRRCASTTAGRVCFPPAAALDRILEDTGYLALAATTPGGVDAGDVLHAVDRVRQVVEDGGSLADAADRSRRTAKATNEVESLPLEPGRTDVVRLMNLHKAKGLEANVVFLADPNGGVPPRVDVHIERTDLKAHGWFKVVRQDGELVRRASCSASTPTGRRTKAAELPYLQAEEDRLLYVAATRARELLVVSRWTGNTTEGRLGRSERLPRQARRNCRCRTGRGRSAVDAARLLQ